MRQKAKAVIIFGARFVLSIASSFALRFAISGCGVDSEQTNGPVFSGIIDWLCRKPQKALMVLHHGMI